MKSLSAACHIT